VRHRHAQRVRTQVRSTGCGSPGAALARPRRSATGRWLASDGARLLRLPPELLDGRAQRAGDLDREVDGGGVVAGLHRDDGLSADLHGHGELLLRHGEGLAAGTDPRARRTVGCRRAHRTGGRCPHSSSPTMAASRCCRRRVSATRPMMAATTPMSAPTALPRAIEDLHPVTAYTALSMNRTYGAPPMSPRAIRFGVHRRTAVSTRWRCR